MRTTKRPDNETAEGHAKLDIFFPKNEDKWGITLTMLTLIEALGEEIMEAFEPHQLSSKAKYAIIQYGRFRKLLYKIVNEEYIDEEFKKEHSIKYIPTVDWENQEDWDKKYEFIVKKSYEELKKDGKL